MKISLAIWALITFEFDIDKFLLQNQKAQVKREIKIYIRQLL